MKGLDFSNAVVSMVSKSLAIISGTLYKERRIFEEGGLQDSNCIVSLNTCKC